MFKSGKTQRLPITRDTLKFMFRLVWREKPHLFLLYFLDIVFEVSMKMIEIILPKFIIDEVAAILGGGAAEEHLPRAALFAGLIVGLHLIVIVFDNINGQLMSYISQWFTEYIDIKIGEHAMKMDFEHTENPEALDTLNKAKEGMDWYSGGVCGVMFALVIILRNAAMLFGVITLILMTCPLLLPVQILSLIIITIFNARNNNIDAASFLKLAKSNRVFGYVLFQLADFRLGKDIRLYESADMMCRKADSFADEQIAAWTDCDKKKCKNSWVMDIVNSFRDGLSYFYIGYMALTGAISVGDFSMCVASASTFYWSLHAIVTGIQDINKKCAYAHRYIEFMNYPAAMPKGNSSVKQGEHIIEFVNVSFRYPRTENYVLRNINITIKPGEHLSIVGLNGAGKTTFVKLLCRLYDVTEGAILIDGVNIKDYSEEEYRKLFAVVFQDFFLFAFSLRENIALTGESDADRINEVLKQSGLYEDAQKLDNGLDTLLFKGFDEKGTDLSGGQRQKAAISRALYRNSPVVILDEPTAALDPVAEYDIYRRFNTLVGGKTAIYISHRLSSCKFCDRIAVFADDTIKEYGTHDQLVNRAGGIYAEMFAAQAQYYVDTV
ncbi:MAG: ABC transporter ATP-binding protein/permease [Acetatifactor sp.]|nr:ABC transporter ATP-binding protein/permease [Acetatifactor sp.]